MLDFDGVLAESNAEKDGAFVDFCNGYLHHNDAMLAYHLEHHARPRREKFVHYAELMGRSGDLQLIEDMAREFSRIVKQRVINCPEVPGTRSFLAEFSALVPLYISSVTPQEELRDIIAQRRIARYIVEAFGTPPHAKPEAVGFVLKREGLRPDQVAFVGDSASDYRVAHETGLLFLGRDSGQSFAGIAVDLYTDMWEIATKLRQLI